MFPNIGVPENGWFIVENPLKMDDLGVPLWLETPRWNGLHFHKVGRKNSSEAAAPVMACATFLEDPDSDAAAAASRCSCLQESM